MKSEIIKKTIEYKEKMIEFFIFNKRNKDKYDTIRDEIIKFIDWPIGDEPARQDGILWRTVTDWLNLYCTDF